MSAASAVILPQCDEPSGLRWQTWSGWVTLYQHRDDGFWVEHDMGPSSPTGLTHAAAVAWIKAHHPRSVPVLECAECMNTHADGARHMEFCPRSPEP